MSRVEMKRLLRSAALGLLVGVSTFGLGVAAPASGGGGGGSARGGGVDSTATPDTPTGAQVIKLSNIRLTYNGATPKGDVTLGYADDGSAQSMDFSLSKINVPDGSVLPVEVVTGNWGTVISYYTYYGIIYKTTPGSVTVNHGSVTLSLSRLKGDVIPDFPLPTLGTTEIRIYSPDGATQILGGVIGKLRP